MKRKLTESQLRSIVRKVINEDIGDNNDYIIYSISRNPVDNYDPTIAARNDQYKFPKYKGKGIFFARKSEAIATAKNGKYGGIINIISAPMDLVYDEEDSREGFLILIPYTEYNKLHVVGHIDMSQPQKGKWATTSTNGENFQFESKISKIVSEAIKKTLQETPQFEKGWDDDMKRERRTANFVDDTFGKGANPYDIAPELANAIDVSMNKGRIGKHKALRGVKKIKENVVGPGDTEYETYLQKLQEYQRECDRIDNEFKNGLSREEKEYIMQGGNSFSKMAREKEIRKKKGFLLPDKPTYKRDGRITNCKLRESVDWFHENDSPSPLEETFQDEFYNVIEQYKDEFISQGWKPQAFANWCCEMVNEYILNC